MRLPVGRLTACAVPAFSTMAAVPVLSSRARVAFDPRCGMLIIEDRVGLKCRIATHFPLAGTPSDPCGTFNLARIVCNVAVDHLPRVKEALLRLGDVVFTDDREETSEVVADADVLLTKLSVTYGERLLSGAQEKAYLI